jgi:RNA polymerase sigma-70 factor (ECF subfamily)
MRDDKELITQLYKDQYDGIYRFSLKALGSREEAMDAAQESFRRMMHCSGISVLKSPGAYLWRITRNLVKEIIRGKALHAKYMLPQSEDMDAHRCEAPDPECRARDREELESLLDAVNRLPSRCREVFVLKRFDGLSHKKIAKRLGISTKTVENHMVNALLTLRKHLSDP